MSKNNPHHLLISSFIIIWVLFPDLLNACAVCFGDPESSMVQGVNMAILTMGGVTGSVLGGFVLFYYQIKKRFKLTGKYKENDHIMNRKGE